MASLSSCKTSGKVSKKSGGKKTGGNPTESQMDLNCTVLLITPFYDVNDIAATIKIGKFLWIYFV